MVSFLMVNSTLKALILYNVMQKDITNECFKYKMVQMGAPSRSKIEIISYINYEGTIYALIKIWHN